MGRPDRIGVLGSLPYSSATGCSGVSSRPDASVVHAVSQLTLPNEGGTIAAPRG